MRVSDRHSSSCCFALVTTSRHCDNRSFPSRACLSRVSTGSFFFQQTLRSFRSYYHSLLPAADNRRCTPSSNRSYDFGSRDPPERVQLDLCFYIPGPASPLPASPAIAGPPTYSQTQLSASTTLSAEHHTSVGYLVVTHSRSRFSGLNSSLLVSILYSSPTTSLA